MPRRSLIGIALLFLLGCAGRSFHTNHFKIEYHDPLLSRKRVTQEVEEALEKISSFFGIDFQGKITIKEVSDLEYDRPLRLASYNQNLILINSFSRDLVFHEVAHVLAIYGYVNPRCYLHEGVAMYMEDKFAHKDLIRKYSGGLHHFVSKR